MQRLRIACERAKRTLSSAMQASIELDSLIDALLDEFDCLGMSATPFSLCFEGANWTNIPVIPRNSTIPNKKSQTFSTMEDNQNSIMINVYEGENEKSVSNKFLDDRNCF